jgi:hypothetical protein
MAPCDSGFLPHKTAPIEGNGLKLGDLLVCTAFVHLMPRLERLLRAFYARFMEVIRTLMLEVSISRFQCAIFLILTTNPTPCLLSFSVHL